MTVIWMDLFLLMNICVVGVGSFLSGGVVCIAPCFDLARAGVSF